MEERNYCVYKHTSPSGKVYIGLTSKEPSTRWNNGAGYMGNRYFNNAINKYGWENIKSNVIKEKLTKQEASEMEVKLIDKYNANNPEYGYNLTSGGETGWFPNEDVIERWREANFESGHLKINQEMAGEIRTLHCKENVSRAELAKTFNMSRGGVSDVIRNETWYDAKYTPPVNKTAKDVAAEIRELHLTGNYSYEQLGEMFNLSGPGIGKVVRNVVWCDDEYKPQLFQENKSKLNKKIAKAIREDYARGEISQRQLAKKYQVHNATVSAVVRNETYYDENYEYKSRYTDLTFKQATEIREHYKNNNISMVELSLLFDVANSTIWRVLNNEINIDKNYNYKKKDFIPASKERKEKIGKLNFKIAEQIRDVYKKGGVTQTDLAKEYGVSTSNIGHIVNYKTWVL